jgi:hypothetical protein
MENASKKKTCCEGGCCGCLCCSEKVCQRLADLLRALAESFKKCCGKTSKA